MVIYMNSVIELVEYSRGKRMPVDKNNIQWTLRSEVAIL